MRIETSEERKTRKFLAVGFLVALARLFRADNATALQ
jgi:hypothetical protein